MSDLSTVTNPQCRNPVSVTPANSRTYTHTHTHSCQSTGPHTFNWKVLTETQTLHWL